MNYIKYYKRIRYLLELIEKGQAFSPKLIAIKFKCSEKTVRNMINCLRDEGYNIRYCKYSKKYFSENH